jgi:hypothetical protein
MPLLLTSARACDAPQSFTMSMCMCGDWGCGQERLPDLLSVSLQMFLYGSNDIDPKMRTILYGKQLSVSWCTSRVHFGAGLNHSPACPASRLPLVTLAAV